MQDNVYLKQVKHTLEAWIMLYIFDGYISKYLNVPTFNLNLTIVFSRAPVW